MITEDFVSFETAKLLKEKGFTANIHEMYDHDGKFCESTFTYVEPYYSCYAPTLQMAMKWLREVHRIFLNVSYIPEHFAFTYRVVSPSGETKFVTYVDTYEEACEAAIKYCLENLI